MKKNVALVSTTITALASLLDAAGIKKVDFTISGRDLTVTSSKKTLFTLSKSEFKKLDSKSIVISAIPGEKNWKITFKDAKSKTILSKSVASKWFSKTITKKLSMIASMDSNSNISLRFSKDGSSFNAIMLSAKMQEKLEKKSFTMKLRKGMLTLGKTIGIEIHTLVDELVTCDKNTCKKHEKTSKIIVSSKTDKNKKTA